MSFSTHNDVKIASGAVVCVDSSLRGNITIGSMTVIHPKATLIAEAGPIIIGENNIIEEQASIIHKSEEEVKNENPIRPTLSVGVNNVFEVGCEIYAKVIGDHNVFEPKCFVGPNVEIGNGCIIGAGCRLTVAEKIPDLTVVTGHHCLRSTALDKPPDADDLVRQQDELTVMSEIFSDAEFSNYSSEEKVCAIFQAHVLLPSSFVLTLSKDMAQTDFPISHLPAIRLVTYLPPDYPSMSSPEFTLSCCWLPKSKLDRLSSELQKLWGENCCEILFIWCSFLKEQSLDSLKIIRGYDLNEKCVEDVSKPNQSCSRYRSDYGSKTTTAGSGASSSKSERNNNRSHYRRKNYRPKETFVDEPHLLKVKAKEELMKKLVTYRREAVKQLYFRLVDYNATKSDDEFRKALQDCNVCFCSIPGEICKLLTCGHVTCIECLKRMCEVHIKHGTMESIVCSQENCGLEIPTNLIRDLVTEELFDQFDRLMLHRTLDKISNMTYCPRLHCQYPVSFQGEDNLAVCPNCKNAFCIFCKRAYHGIEGCRLKSDEKRELIAMYENGGHEKRLELEKRYGKKQLTELVNAAQSELWMSENSKKCPCCHINIEKNDGCNKMVCRKCNTNFCWMCLTRLSSLNPYLHFQDPKSKCFNLLFEGTYEEGNGFNRDFDNDFDEEMGQ